MVTAAKATSQIGLHMSIAFAVMYAATGSIAFGGLAAMIEPLCVVILLPFHDRLWDKIRVRIENQPGQRRQRVVERTQAA